MFPILTSNIVLVQALISAELMCCVFYLVQWLFADFIISHKTRENMKELGDLILTSTLLLFICGCHFQYTDPAVHAVTATSSKVVRNLRLEAMHVYKAIAWELSGVGKPLHIAHLAGVRLATKGRASHRI